MVPPTTLSERELLAILATCYKKLEARELEVERRTQALNLNTGRDDAKIRSAAPSLKSSQIRPSQERAPIKPKSASSQTASLPI